MDLSNKASEILLTCGDLTKTTRKFHEHTTMQEIHDYLRESFSLNEPQSYQIVYYDAGSMSFVNLEKQLQNGLNPFRSNGPSGVQSTTTSVGLIHLYIVSRMYSDHGSDDDAPRVSDSVKDESPSVNSLMTNDDTSQDSSSSNQDRSIVIRSSSPSSSPQPQQRLVFSLDVKPIQKPIYKSDQFSVRKKNPNGRIAHVQGIKRDEQKMVQVLPKLRIPSQYIQSGITLLVAIVTEKLDNGMRIWYKYPHKGFLPEGFGKDTEKLNPIQLNLDRRSLTTDGNFELKLQMITKWDKTQREDAEFYRFDNQKTRELHFAEHDSTAPRLFCVLQRDNYPLWETFCLSDFIRTPKSMKRQPADIRRERTPSPKRKRKKATG